jgi:hypothetical protein
MSRSDSLGRWLTVVLLLNGAAAGAAQARFKMAAVSPLADFSFDYQDLLFVPAR